jgi:hypothetical protein
VRKPFSKEQHQQDDLPAKLAVSGYISKNWGVTVEEGGQYDVDLVCMWGQEVMSYVEVERRHNWTDEFPFNTVHVPGRKAKFFNLSNTTFLFSVRSDLKKAMWCSGVKILESEIKLLNNKHCENEDFFVVPLDQWTLVEL